MNSPINGSVSMVDIILENYQQGVHPEKIRLMFPWVKLSPADRHALIEKARGYSPANCSLLKLLAFMVEDVPVEFRWDQIDVLIAGFQYLGWDDLQKQIALNRIEQALSDLRGLVEQQRPDLRGFYFRYLARFHLLRGSFYYEKIEFLQAVEDFKLAVEAFQQCSLFKPAARLSYVVEAITALLEDKIQPLEVVPDDAFLLRFLHQKELEYLERLEAYRVQVTELEEKIRSKMELLQSIEEQIHRHQNQANQLQN